MLSLFHIGGPYGERESFQTRILGSYKIHIPLCCPRSANNREGSHVVATRPHTPSWGPKAPDPFSLAQRMLDKAEPGQLQNVFRS